MWQLLAGILLAFYSMNLSACASSGNPAVADPARVSQIQLNVSTKEDVQRLLGQPNSMSKHSGGYYAIPGLKTSAALTPIETWNYTHLNVQVDPATFIPVVGLFAGGANSNLNSLTVVFDEQGIVRHISSTQTQGRSGMGAGSSNPTTPANSPSDEDQSGYSYRQKK
ncbi:MAG TPA: hypothetical protein VJ746_06020 [Nitrospira sp.]|nr:hypothetical protein [Nitrospira sp.]